MSLKPFDFTHEEWDRNDGLTVEVGGELRIWNKNAMQWNCYDATTKRPTRVISPDHERARANPETAPLYALIHRMTSPPRKHLRLVQNNEKPEY